METDSIDLGLRHLYARPVEGTNYVIFFIKPGYTMKDLCEEEVDILKLQDKWFNEALEKGLGLGKIPRYFA